MVEHNKLYFSVSKALISSSPTTLFNVYAYLEVILLSQTNLQISNHWRE